MATKTLEIAIVGTNKSATKAFKEVDDAAGTTEGKLRQLGDTIGPAVATAAAAVVGAVGFALKSAWSAAEESAKIGRETERVLESTGATAWTSADKVSALAQSISEVTGADDELIQSGANLLLTFTQVQNKVGAGNDIFDQATQLALDMSTALGTDMSSASIQLGKALNDPIRGITALSRAGVSFTEDQKSQIRTLVESGNVLEAQKIILAELSKEFGGAAEAAATPVDKLRVKLGNLQENIGGALIPAVSKAADVLSTITDSFLALPEPVKIVTLAIGGLGTGVAGSVLVVSKLVAMFGDSLKPVMDFARRQFDNAALAVGEMATKMGASQTAGANLASGLSSGVVPALGGVMAAATLAFGVWTMYQQEQAAADARAKAFSDTLDAQTGKLTANSYAQRESVLAAKNQIDNLNNAGISVRSFSDALADNSHALSASKVELLELAGIDEKAYITKDSVIRKLKEEGGARNDLVLKLAEQGQLDRGLITTILEQIDAYDRQQQAIKEKVRQQAIANGKTEEEAAAAANAASENLRHADSIKAVAEELRAQTDPYFAAWRAQQQLTEANNAYILTNLDSTRSDADKKSAWMAAAGAAISYKGDLLALDEAQKRDGATVDALNGQLNDLARFGLDVTGQSALNARSDLAKLGRTADEVGAKEVKIPVDLEMRKVQQRLDWLKAQTDPSTGFVPLEALYAVPFAKGGMVPDGLFTVGEQGPELGVKQGSSVRIFSNPDTKRMLNASAGSGQGDVNVYVSQPAASAYDIGRELRWQLAVAR